jgi:hypothetical protein
VIAGGEGHDTPSPFLLRKPGQAIARPAQFEAPAGLEALQFKPDPAAPDLTFDQGRSVRQTDDTARRIDDVITGNFDRFD